MKKFALMTLLIAALASCRKEKVQEKLDSNQDPVQEVVLTYNNTLKPAVFEYTSTGCPGCGSWGKPTFYNIVNEFQNNIVPIAVHIKYGDPMITTTSEAIAANPYGQIYTPQIWTNDTNGVQLVNGMISAQASINYLRQLINNAQSENICYIDGKITKKSGNKSELKIGIKSKNLIESNEYYLSCYLMQDGISNNQSGYASNPAIHNFVIRNSVNGVWGSRVILKNQLFEEVVKFESNYVQENHYYSLILWQKENSRYIPLGGFVIK